MRALRRIIITLVILAGLLVVVDRGADWLAERQIADRIGTDLVEYGVEAEPDVDIAGFPFLTQVSNGVYEKITVDVGDVQVDDWELERATLTAHSVEAPVSALFGGSSTPEARTVDGVAVVPYDVVESLSGEEAIQLSKGDGRTVDMLVERTVLDTTVSFAGSGEVTIADGGLHVEVSDLQPTGGVDVDVAPMAVSFDLPVPALPYDLELTGVRPTPDGFEIEFRGRDVPLSR